MRSEPLICLGSLFLMVEISSAFSIRSNVAVRKVPSTALHVAEKMKPRWTELPRARADKKELSGVEMNTGRLAMLGFFGLLANEIISGESFGEQIVDVVTSVSGVN